MLFNDLFKVQSILESGIVSVSGITEDSIGSASGSDLRFLALIVKTGEIANLTKCYKFNQNPKDTDRQKLIVRYADVLQFLLSIGNYHNFNIINRETIMNVEKIDEQAPLFLSIHKSIFNLMNCLENDEYMNALHHYIELFAKIMNLGELLGLTEADMFKFYEQQTHLASA
jgi:dimeric dUTPase (all-alpha-NTP-PPase superfamily)